MKKKTARQIFQRVDPHLRIIDGGTRTYRRAKQKDWDASGGAVCPKCGEEAVRFRPQDGVCRQCADGLNEKEIRDEKKRAKQLAYVKAHNARIDKNKRKAA